METRQRYREKAAECSVAADHTNDPGERIKLLSIARLFVKLSEHVTHRFDRSTAHRSFGRPRQGILSDS